MGSEINCSANIHLIKKKKSIKCKKGINFLFWIQDKTGIVAIVILIHVV